MLKSNEGYEQIKRKHRRILKTPENLAIKTNERYEQIWENTENIVLKTRENLALKTTEAYEQT
jgi:hypothetical protein